MSLSYWLRFKGSRKEQPTAKVLCDCWEYSQQQKGKGFGWNINTAAEEYGLNAQCGLATGAAEERMDLKGM